MFNVMSDPVFIGGQSQIGDNIWIYMNPNFNSSGTTGNEDGTGNQSASLAEYGWTKPYNANFIKITAFGGGGGGAGGMGSLNGSTSGGSGGGAGVISIGMWPAFMFPDNIKVYPGAGGRGGQGDAGGLSLRGNHGVSSVVTTSWSSYNGTFDGVGLTSSFIIAGMHGLGATNSTAAASGTSSGIRYGYGPVNTLGRACLPMSGGGVFFSEQSFDATMSAGSAGGGPSAGGQSLTPRTNFCGGAGGGGKTTNSLAFQGGSVNATTMLPQSRGGFADSAGSRDGGSGVFLWKYMVGTGGAGGCSSILATTRAGAGGNGAFGCGGGGGGAANAQNYGGFGGNGGSGLIIIEVF